jgi:hypothetical protein
MAREYYGKYHRGQQARLPYARVPYFRTFCDMTSYELKRGLSRFIGKPTSPLLRERIKAEARGILSRLAGEGEIDGYSTDIEGCSVKVSAKRHGAVEECTIYITAGHVTAGYGN